MIWKIVIVFLCVMVLVGMIGKLLFPDRGGWGAKRGGNSRAPKPGKCVDCGRPLIGKGPCACRKNT